MKRFLPLLPCLLLGFSLAAEPPKFPEPYDSEPSKEKPMSARDAAAGFKVPPGFHVEVFASEPDVRNPIACCWDTKGRFWVAENYTYAETKMKFDLNLRDRVLIFHDKDGDGKPDERKVFIDTVQRLTSVEVGLGGVWLMCPPQLLFVPDKNGDDIPDGPPEVVLEGFDVPEQNYHNFANGLKWGPDGWLYGRCGASAPGNVKRPDQGPQDAVPLRGGIWRYHPHRKVFEALCHGTTNPWGHDWDAFGECFFINTVGGHVWHMIPGAHYSRSHTLDPNPLVYEPMEMIADHWHFDVSKGWNQKAVNDSRNTTPLIDKLGGGHAHIGCMIYNGNNWPAEHRGKLFTLNQHGRRINVEKLERKGSGYVAKHEPDMFFASDPFFRGLELSQGPDGSVYVLDWNDTGECHEHNGVMRSTGRIYRIRYGESKPVQLDFATKSIAELWDLHADENVWMVRMARRELVERHARKPLPYDASLEATITDEKLAANRRLNVTQTLAALGQLNVLVAVRSDLEAIRAWAFRAACDPYRLDGIAETNSLQGWPQQDLPVRLAYPLMQERSPYVKLVAASQLTRLEPNLRCMWAVAIAGHDKDVTDENLQKLVWYGILRLVDDRSGLFIGIHSIRMPSVRKWIFRALTERLATKPDLLKRALHLSLSTTIPREEILNGILEGLAGVRKITPPENWESLKRYYFHDVKYADSVRQIDVIFGDGRAIDEVKKLALDDKANLEQRKAALRSLIDANPPDLKAICEKLVKVQWINSVAVRGLAKFDDAGPAIVQNYRRFHPSERAIAVDVLSTRPSFAMLLLDEIAAGRMSRNDVSAAQARTIRGFDKPELTAKLASVWGEFRDSPKDKQDLIAKLKADLTPAVLAKADKSAGRAVFAKTCATCHKLYGQGESIGPDLTGAGRKDMDYLLSNIIDPSAVVTKDFQMTRFQLKDGRTISGLILATAPKTITIQTDKEKAVVGIDDIESRKASTLSLMPDGLLQTLKPAEIRDLFAYLQSERQVDLTK